MRKSSAAEYNLQIGGFIRSIIRICDLYGELVQVNDFPYPSYEVTLSMGTDILLNLFNVLFSIFIRDKRSIAHHRNELN